MSRRSRRNLPPRLPDHGPLFVEPEIDVERPAAPPTPRAQLVSARLAGKHGSVGRREVEHVVGRLASGAPDAALGLELGAVGRDEAHSALTAIWGWDQTAARSTIDPDRTLAALQVAAARIASVAAGGGRVAFATGRPASLLPLYRAVASHARTLGAAIAAGDEQRIDGRSGRALWWLDGVAALTDGDALLADDGVDAAEEWLFAVGRPDLVVADQAYAAVAAAAARETVALADFDDLALGVAARRGRRICVVPVRSRRPPAAYRVVIERLTDPVSDSGGVVDPHRAPDAQGSQSTT